MIHHAMMRGFVGGDGMTLSNHRRKQFGRRGHDSLSRSSALRFFGVAVAAVVLLSPPAVRADCYWNVQSGDWSTGVNWGGGAVPTANDNAYVVNGGAATITLPGESCGNLTLGAGAGSGDVQMANGSLSATSCEYIGYESTTGSFTQSGGSNSMINGSLSLGYEYGGIGTYNLINGQLSAGGEAVGRLGIGVFEQSGGSNCCSTSLVLGGYYTYSFGEPSGGTYNLSGGTISANAEYVGASNPGAFLQSAGLNVVGGSRSGQTLAPMEVPAVERTP